MTKDETLQMVIDYLEYQYEIGAWGQDLEGLIDCCKEALEQPAQEPWGWYDNHDIYNAKQSDESIPLYTHPSPAWQGLSDDEINNLLYDDFGIDIDEWFKYARAIEQALKEKNT